MNEGERVRNMNHVELVVTVLRKMSDFKLQYPGKKALQKLVYLIGRRGVRPDFHYSIHYYGPYSSKLDDTVHSLQLQGIVEIVPDGMNHRVRLIEELQEFIEDPHLSEKESQEIEYVLRNFGTLTPYDLEVITTADFVAGELGKILKPLTEEAIVEGVKKIKGDKFPDQNIRDALAVLKQHGYVWN